MKKWLGFLKFGKKPPLDADNNKKDMDNELLKMDFFCQLSYMAAISTSGIDRSGLFSHAAHLPYLSSRYFKKVVFVAKAFNHDYAEACNIIGQATEEAMVKELLLRLSGALSSGESIADFLERETMVFSEIYSNSYERKLDSLAKWTDAYIALIMTTAIVTVMAVVTLMIGNATIAFIISLAIVTIIVTIAGAWFIYSSTPRENKTHSLAHGSKEQEIGKKFAKFILPICGVIVAIQLVSGVDIGWVLVTAGILLVPLGLVSRIDSIKIDKRDTDVGGLLRSLGGVSQATGITVNEAMGRLDFRSLGSLAQDVNLLFTRLLARINPEICWNRFVCDTGSEQINRSVRIFWDAVSLGGEPQKIGNHASNFAMRISLLRAKRNMIGTGFFWLTLTMQTVLAGLLVFIYETMVAFSSLISTITPGDVNVPNMPTIGMFNSDGSQVAILYFMIVIIILVLTISNAFSVYAVSGGHIFNLAFFLSLMAVLSGIAFLVMPLVVNLLFNTLV